MGLFSEIEKGFQKAGDALGIGSGGAAALTAMNPAIALSTLAAPTSVALPLISTGLAAGGDIYGNMQANKRAEAANQLSAQQFAETMAFNRENMAMQKEFAQHGIRWKAADARAAGLSPLVAMGANTISYSPTSVGGGSRPVNVPGQDYGRSILGMLTLFERILALKNNNQSHQVLMEGERLRNTKLARELQNSPPMPSQIRGLKIDQTGINQVPAEQVASGAVGVEKSIKPMQQMTIDGKGRIYFPVGTAAEEALENDLFEKMKYFGHKTKDYAAGLGTGYVKWRFPKWSKNLPSVQKRDQAIQAKKKLIAREFNLTVKDIGYSTLTDTFYIQPKTLKRLNR